MPRVEGTRGQIPRAAGRLRAFTVSGCGQAPWGSAPSEAGRLVDVRGRQGHGEPGRAVQGGRSEAGAQLPGQGQGGAPTCPSAQSPTGRFSVACGRASAFLGPRLPRPGGPRCHFSLGHPGGWGRGGARIQFLPLVLGSHTAAWKHEAVPGPWAALAGAGVLRRPLLPYLGLQSGFRGPSRPGKVRPASDPPVSLPVLPTPPPYAPAEGGGLSPWSRLQRRPSARARAAVCVCACT